MAKSYVEFDIAERKPKTNVYNVRSKSDGFILGKILWHFPWRQYVFIPTRKEETIWSRGCFRDVTNFIEELMNARKKKPDKATKPRSPCEWLQCTAAGMCKITCTDYRRYLEKLEEWRKG